MSRAFLIQLPRTELVDLVVELAEMVPGVQERLTRRQLVSNPAKLAANFRQRLQGWKRARRFIDWREAGGFGRSLEAWLDEIERELLPIDPARAHELVKQYLEADQIFFDHADDSNKGDQSCVASVLLYSSCRCWQSIPRLRLLWVEVGLGPVLVAGYQVEVARQRAEVAGELAETALLPA